MYDFIQEVSEFSPFETHVVPPPVILSACCDAIIVAGKGIGNTGLKGEGVYRKSREPHYQHIHYVDEKTEMEIFFEKDEFNIGYPRSKNYDRINIRSESIMKFIYESPALNGRSPCPYELSTWKYRATDFEKWDYDKEIQLYCTTEENLDRLSKVSEHTAEDSVNVTDPLQVRVSNLNFALFQLTNHKN